MFSFLLFSFAFSWTDQMLAVAGTIGFEQFSYAQQKQLLAIFENAGDEFTRCAQAAAWLYYAERPPFNIRSFNHWHFKSTPLTYDSSRTVVSHVDIDNLAANLESINDTVIEGNNQRTWPYAFSLKLYLASQCDILSPLHVSEYFSDEFPDGDRNGRDFYVYMNGNIVSLYDAWESGCGYFSTSMDFDSAEDWNKVDSLRDELMLEFKQFEFTTNDVLEEETYNYTRDVVYNGLKNLSVLTDDYIKQCQLHTKEQLFRAGKTIAQNIKGINIIEISKQLPAVSGFRTSEIVAWSLLLVFTPFAALLVWKKHFGN